MNERSFTPPENTPENVIEKFPSKEEIESVFTRLLKGREHRVQKCLTDERGVYLYEIETLDESGDKLEYCFQRAAYDHTIERREESMRFSAFIQAAFYSGDMPVGGKTVANYLDGQWEYKI